MSEKKIIKIEDLYKDVEGMAEEDWLIQLLNQDPPDVWVKTHPYIKVEAMVNGVKTKVPYKYLNIDRIEFLLKKIFKKFKIEVLEVDSAFNGMYVTVRVHYMHPITGEWEYHDGVGAKDLQVKSGSTSADLSSLNNGAITMAVPMAKTFAIKNACSHFGKLFGSELNGKDDMDYSVSEGLQNKAGSKVAALNAKLENKTATPEPEPAPIPVAAPPPPAPTELPKPNWDDAF